MPHFHATWFGTWQVLRGLVRNLEVNLGEHFHEDMSVLTVEELDNVGKFFVTKPVKSIL